MRAFLVCKNELGEETLKAIGEAYNSDDDGTTDGIYLANCAHWLFLILKIMSSQRGNRVRHFLITYPRMITTYLQRLPTKH